MSLGPKKAPLKRAKVFNKSRDRIVKTERVLQREVSGRARERAETQALKDALNSPIIQAMGEHFQRELGQILAEEAVEVIRPLLRNKPDLFRAFVFEGLRRMSNFGDNIASAIFETITENELSTMDVAAAQSPIDGTHRVYLQYDIPHIRLRATRQIARG